MRKQLKDYKIERGQFKVTTNKKERTYSIYTLDGEHLSTVNDGELWAELDRLEREV